MIVQPLDLSSLFYGTVDSCFIRESMDVDLVLFVPWIFHLLGCFKGLVLSS